MIKRIIGLLMGMGLMVSVGCGGNKENPTGPAQGPRGRILEVYSGEHENGNKVEYQFYRNGNEEVKHGYYKVFDGDGNIIIEGEYKEDKRWHGEFEFVVIVNIGIKNGFDDDYVETEEEPNDYSVFRARFTYSAGKRNGKMVGYYENGQIEIEGNYKDGKEEGKWVEYYKNGQILVEGNYKDGKEEGKWVEYYNSGEKKRQGNYKDGERDGKWVEYYSNGKIKKEENYKSRRRDGKWAYYDESGQIRWEGNYKDGERNGRESDYDKEGNLRHPVWCWQMGAVVSCPEEE